MKKILSSMIAIAGVLFLTQGMNGSRPSSMPRHYIVLEQLTDKIINTLKDPLSILQTIAKELKIREDEQFYATQLNRILEAQKLYQKSASTQRISPKIKHLQYQQPSKQIEEKFREYAENMKMILKTAETIDEVKRYGQLVHNNLEKKATELGLDKKAPLYGKTYEEVNQEFINAIKRWKPTRQPQPPVKKYPTLEQKRIGQPPAKSSQRINPMLLSQYSDSSFVEEKTTPKEFTELTKFRKIMEKKIRRYQNLKALQNDGNEIAKSFKNKALELNIGLRGNFYLNEFGLLKSAYERAIHNL